MNLKTFAIFYVSNFIIYVGLLTIMAIKAIYNEDLLQFIQKQSDIDDKTYTKIDKLKDGIISWCPIINLAFPTVMVFGNIDDITKFVDFYNHYIIRVKKVKED